MSNILIRTFLAALLTVASLVSLSSCGGGTSISFGDPPNLSMGNITIRINDIPAGGTAVVRLTGPDGFSRTLSQGETLTGLAPGDYQIVADPIRLSGGFTWHVIVDPPKVSVRAGTTRLVVVRYAEDITNALTTQVFASGLEFPTFLAAPANDPRQFILERPGRIRIVRNGVLVATPFLDISDHVFSGGEGGLLSMAFAPDYATSGVFYIYYTNLARDIVVERYTVSANPDRANTIGNYQVIRIPHPDFSNHFGGLAAFGPDGYLWLGTGDGGGAGDPANNAQNRNVLLGKLLRLDVSQSNPAAPYRIPPSNPYATSGGRPEIWAYGLRNPWRFAFDLEALVLPDVGQERNEELNIVGANRAGVNYGWDIMEGNECYGATTCDKTGIETPWIEYTQAATGGCSIIGGYVYRGKAFPELAGHFFYSDYCANFLKSFALDGIMPTEQITWGVSGLTGITSFGRDSEGELYLLSSSGTVWKIVRRITGGP